ncbi:MAG: hypothetical protein U0793_04730 [Gemmataceae bacterium]
MNRDHPGQIDLTTRYSNSAEVLHTKAIFEQRGATLRYCVGAPGKDRPDEFRTEPGDERTLVILRRAP